MGTIDTRYRKDKMQTQKTQTEMMADEIAQAIIYFRKFSWIHNHRVCALTKV